MPTISTPSKIASTKAQGAHVYFSGSTAPEREKLLHEIQTKTDAVFVPPYDHPDIILGQGTLALEFEQQVKDLCKEVQHSDSEHEGYGWRFRETRRQQQQQQQQEKETNGDSNSNSSHDTPTSTSEGLDAVIAPCGGGGMLSGIATALTGTGISVFGSEPSYQGADDARRSLASGTRIDSVSTLTIADGLRTPLGKIPWSIISDPTKLRAIYSVSESQIKSAMRLIYERMKVVVEPSAAVPLAVCLFDEAFRSLVEREGGREGWNVGVVLSGGNTTMEAVARLFAEEAGDNDKGERAGAKVGMDGGREVQNVAG